MKKCENIWKNLKRKKKIFRLKWLQKSSLESNKRLQMRERENRKKRMKDWHYKNSQRMNKLKNRLRLSLKVLKVWRNQHLFLYLLLKKILSVQISLFRWRHVNLNLVNPQLKQDRATLRDHRMKKLKTKLLRKRQSLKKLLRKKKPLLKLQLVRLLSNLQHLLSQLS